MGLPAAAKPDVALGGNGIYLKAVVRPQFLQARGLRTTGVDLSLEVGDGGEVVHRAESFDFGQLAAGALKFHADVAVIGGNIVADETVCPCEIGEDFLDTIFESLAAGQLIQILDAHAVHLLRAFGHLIHRKKHILAADFAVLDHQIGQLADLARSQVGGFGVKYNQFHSKASRKAFMLFSAFTMFSCWVARLTRICISPPSPKSLPLPTAAPAF